MGQWIVRAADGRGLSVATIFTGDGLMIAVGIPRREEGVPLLFNPERAQEIRYALGVAIGEAHQGETWSPS